MTTNGGTLTSWTAAVNPRTDLWKEWEKCKQVTKREPEDLISFDVDQHELRHMRISRPKRSLEDEEDEGEEVAKKMKMLVRMPECPPPPGDYLAPPMLRRSNPTTTLPMAALRRGVSTLDATSTHSVKSVSSRTTGLEDVELNQTEAALSA